MHAVQLPYSLTSLPGNSSDFSPNIYHEKSRAGDFSGPG
jgi:hypothetical protein